MFFLLIFNIMNFMNEKSCPCKSKKFYKDCCQKYHLNKEFPKNALELMRSRFSAYALKEVDYIIKTSHPKNVCFTQSMSDYKKEIENFCNITTFKNLEILDFTEEKDHAFVTFVAYLTTDEKNITFTEISHFENNNNKWLYKDGQIFEGRKTNL